MTDHRADVAVIGGGIVGLASALALAERHRQSVVVIEAEPDIAAHQTSHNSGVIHSGLYYPPDSAKARLCREGLASMYRFCEEESVPCRRTGKLVVATAPADLPRLDRLEALGRANGVVVRRLPAAGLRDVEPEVAGLAGLWVEETGVVDYATVAAAIRRRLAGLGGSVRVGHRVHGIVAADGRYVVETTGGTVTATRLVTCAGLQADRVARMAGATPDIRIVAVRGEYYHLRPERAHLVRALIYPVADPALPFLGVHLTRGVDGAVEAGPNAVLATHRHGYRWSDWSAADLLEWARFPGFWRFLGHHWRTGLSEVRRSWSPARFARSLQALVPALRVADLVPGGAGVRAQALDRHGRLVSDFVFAEQPRGLHVLNAPSPAATASLAIGRVVADRLMTLD